MNLTELIESRQDQHLSELYEFLRIPSVSAKSEHKPDIERAANWVADHLRSAGFKTVEVIPTNLHPLVYAESLEAPGKPTVLFYGHYDVQPAEPLDLWTSPAFEPEVRDGNIFGRGTADNKGQHTINLAALGAVLAERDRLGFNAKWLIEMGEETGSSGLRELVTENRDLFAADVLIASDGTRLSADRPTILLGGRGAYPIDLWIDAREGGHHSGNWGGLLSSPAIQLVHALATIVGPTGKVNIREWLPEKIPDSVQRALADCEVKSEPGEPEIDPNWGEPGLSAAEKVYGWCSFEILAMTAGNPESPVNAVPPRAWARGQLRFVVGVDPDDVLPALRRHLDRHGFPMVQIARGRDEIFMATRTDPDHPWVHWAIASIQRSTNKRPAVIPNSGGTLPNDFFSESLGLPTIWIPHSYRACSQHAPNEHLPLALAREALALMAGLYWDLGEPGTPDV